MAKTFAVAPMLDWTNRECRALHRLLCPEALLYTEMVSTGAIIFGDRAAHLDHLQDEPCALQLAGGDPQQLAQACTLAQPFSYQEINLNAGCPSDRVQHNKIGAVLMLEPRLVADCLTAMQEYSPVPVSLKHRLAVDEQPEEQVFGFIETILRHSPCRKFIVHARRAWLNGLSPRENRTVPPLNYGLVREIKHRYPDLEIILNGGLTTIDECAAQLEELDGVMVGRAAYENPELLLEVPRLFGGAPRPLEALLPTVSAFLEERLAAGERLFAYSRHLLGLFRGRKGSRRYRQILSEEGRRPAAGIEVWQRALAQLELE